MIKGAWRGSRAKTVRHNQDQKVRCQAGRQRRQPIGGDRIHRANQNSIHEHDKQNWLAEGKQEFQPTSPVQN